MCQNLEQLTLEGNPICVTPSPDETSVSGLPVYLSYEILHVHDSLYYCITCIDHVTVTNFQRNMVHRLWMQQCFKYESFKGKTAVLCIHSAAKYKCILWPLIGQFQRWYLLDPVVLSVLPLLSHFDTSIRSVWSMWIVFVNFGGPGEPQSTCSLKQRYSYVQDLI